MGKINHTPGPWRLKRGQRHSPEECDITIAGDVFLLADISGPNYEHCEANARLIAAAPELLEALKEMVRWHIKRGPFDEPLGASEQTPEINSALAAIAKAEAHP